MASIGRGDGKIISSIYAEQTLREFSLSLSLVEENFLSFLVRSSRNENRDLPQQTSRCGSACVPLVAAGHSVELRDELGTRVNRRHPEEVERGVHSFARKPPLPSLLVVVHLRFQ